MVNAGFTQSNYSVGFLPSININKGLEKDWKLNFKTESRHVVKSGVFSEKSNSKYDYALTDFSIISSKKIGINKAIAFGYLLRIRDRSTFENRMIQQFTATKNYSTFRLAHRIVTDQTFSKNEPTDFRLRYRLSIEIPLNGQSLDPKEFYYKLNHEYLNSLQGKVYDLEIRIVNFIGYEFSRKSKLEWGLDYRASSFINDNFSNRFWIAINWYWSL